MRLISVKASNFGSYEELEFDFTKGLTLIAGATGSGKSTLLDAVPWALFGHTSKEGSADEVRAWDADGPTSVLVRFFLGEKSYEVFRSRKPNDLTIIKSGIEIIRGKDLVDTQKRINELLGFDLQTYLAGAVFHEFSATAQFFQAPAKQRRTVIESLVDLSFAVNLSNRSADYKKTVKVARDDSQNEVMKARSVLATVEVQLATNKDRIKTWDLRHSSKIFEADKANRNFDKITKTKRESDLAALRNEINDLKTESNDIFEDSKPVAALEAKIVDLDKKIKDLGDGKCKECGNKIHSDKLMVYTSDRYKLKTEIDRIERDNIRLVQISNDISKLETKVRDVEQTIPVNAYKDQLKQLKEEVNPYLSVTEHLDTEVLKAKLAIDEAQDDLDTLSIELSDVEALQDLINTLRGVQVKNTVMELQTRTNDILAKYFNAEIKVSFELSDADKIDVTIYKDVNICSFTQLSKGQRQLLRVAFGLSVMAVVNNRSTTNFNVIFLDEIFSGLDEELKAQAYQLLEDLSRAHDTVLAVDHSEGLKVLFSDRIDVQLVNGHSEIAKT